MIALDTNIVVRLITEDDPEQVRRARGLILAQGGLVQTTVLLETEWVLRSVYHYDRHQIGSAFAVLMQTNALSVEAADSFATAIEAYREGMDFADAVHVAHAEAVDGFATFDRELAQLAPRCFPETRVLMP